MAVDCLSITEQWIREKLHLQHNCLADVRSLCLPGTYHGKIYHLGISFKNFVRLKTLDLSHNALVSVEGIEHLKMLERLNLYFNRIPSLQEVLVLRKLQNLRELDLRLNPVVKINPDYRLYLVHAMSKLRKLDDFPVRDRERKATIMHFSSETMLEPQQKPPSFTDTTDQRSSELRMASVNRLTKGLSLLAGNDEAALNLVARQDWDQSKPRPLNGSFHQELESQLHHLHHEESSSEIIQLINGYDSECSSSLNQGSTKSILRNSLNKVETHTQTRDRPHRKAALSRSGSLVRTRDGPRVTFVEGHRSVPMRLGQEKTLKPGRVPGEGIFTPHPSDAKANSKGQADNERASWLQTCPGDRQDQILHPPRLSYRSTENRSHSERTSSPPQTPARPQKGSYRKRMELLLSMAEEHWRSDGHHDRSFLSHTVQILSMMEQDVLSGEEEVQALREKMEALTTQTELREKEHRSEIQSLSTQLEQAHGSIENLDQQLRSVLEENVSLQKHLIKLEQRLFSSRMKTLPNTKDNGV